MKTNKIIYFCLTVMLFYITSCNSIIETPPAPSIKLSTEASIYAETFQNGLGQFTQFNDSGKQVWTSSKYQYATISGNVDNVPNSNSDWLISPAVILPDSGTVTSVFSFDYVTRGFANLSNDVSIWISSNYKVDSMPSKVKWTRLYTVEPMINSTGWTMSNAGDISLKAFAGKKVNIAFKYTSTSTQAGTWQIKNFVIKERKPVTLPYSETFLSTKGRFTAINVSGPQVWSMDSHGYTTISGYVSSVNNANEDWLISPKIDLTTVAHAKLTFDHVARYFANLKTEATVWYSEKYDEGLPNLVSDWKQLKTYPFSDPGNWTLTTSHEITLDSCVGKKVSIAFKYISTASKAGTWELKNFYVQEGTPADIYFYEAFDSGLGNFTTNNVKGTPVWTWSSSFGAVMSGLLSGASTDNEDWLISPTIDLKGKASAKLSFDFTINKGVVANMQTNHTLWLSADNGATWEQIIIPTYPAGNTWTFVNSGNVIIPDKFLGSSTFKFAFKYLSSTAESASWEIKNAIIKP